MGCISCKGVFSSTDVPTRTHRAIFPQPGKNIGPAGTSPRLPGTQNELTLREITSARALSFQCAASTATKRLMHTGSRRDGKKAQRAGRPPEGAEQGHSLYCSDAGFESIVPFKAANMEDSELMYFAKQTYAPLKVKSSLRKKSPPMSPLSSQACLSTSDSHRRWSVVIPRPRTPGSTNSVFCLFFFVRLDTYSSSSLHQF